MSILKLAVSPRHPRTDMHNMSARSSLLRWTRIASAVLTLAFGVLHFAFGLLGPVPISFGISKHSYYQLVATPSPNFWLWGVLGLAVPAFLFALPRVRGGRSSAQSHRHPVPIVAQQVNQGGGLRRRLFST